MGKSGDRIRAGKADNVTRTFTRRQLEEHDNEIRRQTIIARQRELQDFIDRRAEEVAKDYFTAENKLDGDKVILYALSIACKVLIEEFGWTPIKHRIDDRMRLVRFTKCVESEYNDVDRYGGLKKYSEFVKKHYGVSFARVEEEITGTDKKSAQSAENGDIKT